jgi:hypothetical protein
MMKEETEMRSNSKPIPREFIYGFGDLWLRWLNGAPQGVNRKSWLKSIRKEWVGGYYDERRELHRPTGRSFNDDVAADDNARQRILGLVHLLQTLAEKDAALDWSQPKSASRQGWEDFKKTADELQACLARYKAMAKPTIFTSEPILRRRDNAWAMGLVPMSDDLLPAARAFNIINTYEPAETMTPQERQSFELLVEIVQNGWLDKLRRCEHKKKCGLLFLAHKANPEDNRFHSRRCRQAAFRSTDKYLSDLRRKRAENAKLRRKNGKRGATTVAARKH